MWLAALVALSDLGENVQHAAGIVIGPGDQSEDLSLMRMVENVIFHQTPRTDHVAGFGFVRGPVVTFGATARPSVPMVLDEDPSGEPALRFAVGAPDGGGTDENPLLFVERSKPLFAFLGVRGDYFSDRF